MGEKLQYDGTTGRLAVREVRNAGTRKMLDSLDYDYQGRITGARYHYALGADTAGPVRVTYTGLGALDSISNHLNNVDSLPEWFKTDAHGNRVRTKRPGHTAGGDTDQLRDFTYDAHGRLTGIEYTGGGGFSSLDVLLYDAAGNNTLHSHLATGDSTQLVMYYGIDDKLVIVNRWVKTGPGGVYEEHRYDALGRRVLSRAEFASICEPSTYGSGRCAHRLDLTFWDGSQVLGETRFIGSGVGLPIQSGVPGVAAGTISYVHAGGIDEPIMIWADTSNIIPFANWKGDYLFGTINGVPEGTGEWPGGKTLADGQFNLGSSDAFIGGLVPGLRDASGLKYRRNRYLNPAVGQFTQVDRIGLRGGPTLYGYVLGDPINLEDPLGLSACCVLPVPVAPPFPPLPLPEIFPLPDELTSGLETLGSCLDGIAESVRQGILTGILIGVISVKGWLDNGRPSGPPTTQQDHDRRRRREPVSPKPPAAGPGPGSDPEPGGGGVCGPSTK